MQKYSNLHFVKTGIVSKELSRIYNDLFERRQESDYADFITFIESQVRPWISQAEEFVEQISTLIRESKS
ncbi:MAG: HEPN domain-containing protein [bacterium]